jgi:hypothetical protein
MKHWIVDSKATPDIHVFLHFFIVCVVLYVGPTGWVLPNIIRFMNSELIHSEWEQDSGPSTLKQQKRKMLFYCFSEVDFKKNSGRM